ncbi:hypothetical protein DSO57_1007533 [Entomophthora muscae]|uniref:Uncharacterized protein n=1 Tax=Entomophthora muscae TaxID=34485 RepID=A0ACC2UT74_9FUNG|nr:hypothetical protein DSO57_1007533 [Entomophthora muscae]
MTSGSFHEASTNYYKSKEFCTNDAQSIQTWFSCLKTTVFEFNVSGLSNIVSILDSLPILAKDKEKYAKLRAASGLCRIRTRHYLQAVHKFLEVDFSACSSISEIIPPTSMVSLTVLSSLAFFSRHDIKNRVLTSLQFKRYLDLEPELREVIKYFLRNEYSLLISALEERRGYFLLNIYVHEHFDFLFNEIKRRAIMDYFKPFKSASLTIAAKAFSTTVAELQSEICNLISEGHLSARLDFECKVLWSKKVDPRTQAHEKVQRLGQKYRREIRTTLGMLRLQQARLA